MAERVPGIIVKIVPDTGIVAPPLFERYPLIIGSGETELPVYDEAVTRAAYGELDALSKTGVNRVIQIGDIPGSSKYEEGVDFVLTGDEIDWTPGGIEPAAGAIYYVTYTYDLPLATAFEPTLYFDENMLYADHGQKTLVAGGINPLTVAADISLQAGAKGVVVAQLNPADGTLVQQYDAVIEKLEKIVGMKLFIVPLDVNSQVNSNIFNHCVVSSVASRKQERTMFVASAKGTSYTTFRNLPALYRNGRAVVPLCYNGEITISGFTGTYDQVYIGAAIAGLLCSVEIGAGVSDSPLPGFQCVGDYTPVQYDILVQAGGSPVSSGGGIPRLVMAITTDTSNAINEDLGVQDIADYTKKYWRERLWEIYKNARITANFGSSLVSTSRTMLERLLSDNVIAGYKDISAVPDSVEPRKWKMYGKIKPMFTFQWMDVEFVFVASL